MPRSLQGQLLVASPKLLDPNFFRSVVLMVQHNDEGALGLILNRPLVVTIEEAWQQVSEDDPCAAEGSLHQGGPCPGPLMVLHADDRHADFEVVPGIFFSTDQDAIKDLVASNVGRMMFFVGYAGWTAGQLESELEDGGWLLSPATPDQIFGGDANLWEAAVRVITRTTLLPGVNPNVIPEDPSMN